MKLMGLGSTVFAGFVAFGAVACAGANGSGAKVAQGDSPASDANLTHATLATAIPGAAGDDAKAEGENLPTTCATEGTIKSTKTCLPAASFGKKLCSATYPEVALAMFAKGTPWTRVYLAADVDAWNASGTGHTHQTKLMFDEEVIVVSKHGAAAAGGIVMTGSSASYDVLRWDGTCVSVMEGELTTQRPPTPKPASIPWSRLDDGTRHALLGSAKVKSSLDSLDKACTGDKKVCEKADKAFSKSVAEAVKQGVALPAPTHRP